MDAPAYSRMMAALLPRGRRLFPAAVGGLMGAVLKACAESLARLDARAQALLLEIEPSTSVELLPDHEIEFGTAALGGTEDERRARVVALQIRRQRYRPADIQAALYTLLGGADGDIDVLEIDHATAAAIGDVREVFRFFVFPGSTTVPIYIESAQRVLDAMAPSHTIGIVAETTVALYDDPHSLYDRDLVGA